MSVSYKICFKGIIFRYTTQGCMNVPKHLFFYLFIYFCGVGGVDSAFLIKRLKE